MMKKEMTYAEYLDYLVYTFPVNNYHRKAEEVKKQRKLKKMNRIKKVVSYLIEAVVVASFVLFIACSDAIVDLILKIF